VRTALGETSPQRCRRRNSAFLALHGWKFRNRNEDSTLSCHFAHRRLVEHRRLSEPCERRVSRASREKRLAGLIAGQVTDLAGSLHSDPGEAFSRAVDPSTWLRVVLSGVEGRAVRRSVRAPPGNGEVTK
jgi:hypothetical protein